MEYTIERVKLGDEAVLAYIQTESWKAGFKDILSADVLERCTQIDKATAMYRRLLEQNVGNGYLLKVERNPHCIAWWDATREKDMPGYAELICIHSLQNQWRKGYGSKILNLFIESVNKIVLLEIDPIVDEVSAARMRFYKRNGFYENIHNHVHPAYREAFDAHHLIVMSTERIISDEEYLRFKSDLCEVVMRW